MDTDSRSLICILSILSTRVSKDYHMKRSSTTLFSYWRQLYFREITECSSTKRDLEIIQKRKLALSMDFIYILSIQNSKAWMKCFKASSGASILRLTSNILNIFVLSLSLVQAEVHISTFWESSAHFRSITLFNPVHVSPSIGSLLALMDINNSRLSR